MPAPKRFLRRWEDDVQDIQELGQDQECEHIGALRDAGLERLTLGSEYAPGYLPKDFARMQLDAPRGLGATLELKLVSLALRETGHA